MYAVVVKRYKERMHVLQSWLGEEDSNLHRQLQRLLAYH